MNELTGGIKNALERGENDERVKQTFINAGYLKNEIDDAFRELSTSYNIKTVSSEQIIKQKVVNVQPQSQPKTTTIQSSSGVVNVIPAVISDVTSANSIQQAPQDKNKQASKVLVIVLIVISLLILIGAAIVGLYWENISNLFIETA